jgi:hypothetical protein
MRGPRAVRFAAGIALLAGSVTGCFGATPTEPPPPSNIACHGATCHYDDISFSFDYPASWHAAEYEVVSSFSSDLVSLSTSAMTCDRRPPEIACLRLVTGHLDAGGLLITWRARGWPNWSFDPSAGASISVGGRSGTRAEYAATEDCQTIGGATSILLTIPDPTPDNWMEMDACLAGPDPGPATAQMQTMLSTVRWKD